MAEKNLEQMQEAGYQGGKIRITHVQNEGVAQDLAARLREHYPDADISVAVSGGLCSYYAEKGSLLIGLETK